jgi:hypothetical protein
VNASSFRAHPEKSPEDSYRQAISDLQRELQNRTEQRDELNRRIALLEAALANLAVVVDDEPFEGGLAKAIRTVLKRVPGKPFHPTEVRDGLKAIGYDISKHTNIMASVHSVLKRMTEGPNAAVQPIRSNAQGGQLYRWKPAVTLKDALIEKLIGGPGRSH